MATIRHSASRRTSNDGASNRCCGSSIHQNSAHCPYCTPGCRCYTLPLIVFVPPILAGLGRSLCCIEDCNTDSTRSASETSARGRVIDLVYGGNGSTYRTGNLASILDRRIYNRIVSYSASSRAKLLTGGCCCCAGIGSDSACTCAELLPVFRCCCAGISSNSASSCAELLAVFRCCCASSLDCLCSPTEACAGGSAYAGKCSRRMLSSSLCCTGG